MVENNDMAKSRNSNGGEVVSMVNGTDQNLIDRVNAHDTWIAEHSGRTEAWWKTSHKLADTTTARILAMEKRFTELDKNSAAHVATTNARYADQNILDRRLVADVDRLFDRVSGLNVKLAWIFGLGAGVGVLAKIVLDKIVGG